MNIYFLFHSVICLYYLKLTHEACKIFYKMVIYFDYVIDYRSQLTHGRKVLDTLDMISKLVLRVRT